MNRDICLSFDYELFFAESGSVDHCMLIPTERILQKLHRVGGKATFFADVTCLMRLRDAPGWGSQFERIREQLAGLAAAGHELALHLHPHWFDAVPGQHRWSFPDYRHYRLQSLTPEQIRSLFLESTALLTEIARQGDTTARITSFRAGGLCLQPFEPIRGPFEEAGLVIDSSVAPGLCFQSETHYADFSQSRLLSPYRFSDDPTRCDERGPFVEVPITTVRRNLIDIAWNRTHLNLFGKRHRREGDGKGLANRPQSLPDRIRDAWGGLTFLTIEGYAPDVVRRLTRRTSANPLVYLCHPKGLSPAALEAIEVLAESGSARFTTIQSIGESVLLRGTPATRSSEG